MARRKKSSEVLMMGDVVDNRPRVETRAPDGPEFFSPDSETGGYKKSDSDTGSAGKRIRRQPQVIDARGTPTQSQVWEDDGPQGSKGETGSSWEDETRSAPREGADWQAPEAKGGSGADMLAPEPAPKPDAPAPDLPPSTPAAKAPSPPPAPKPKPKPAAKAAPKPKTKKKPPAPPQSSKVVAKTMVGSMVDRMRAEAKRKGSLTVEDLDAMQADFDRQAEQLGQALEKSFDNYMEARERAEWDAKRDLPFDRVIVKTFSDLFAEDDYSRFDRVSRRMLPGFFLALNMMLGEELVEEYQEHCRLIVDRVRGELGDGFEWEAIYTNADAKALMLDAAVTIAGYFTAYERRSEWFIGLINGHLAPFAGTPKEEAGWEMTPGGFKRFLDHLFADLRKEIADDKGKLRLTKRHGADTVADIVRILKEIEA